MLDLRLIGTLDGQSTLDLHIQVSIFTSVVARTLEIDHAATHRTVAGLTLCGTLGRPIAVELADSAPRFIDVPVLSDANPWLRHDLVVALFGVIVLLEASKAEPNNIAGELGIGVNGGVDLVQCLEVVEGRSGKHLPVGLGQGVEGLTAQMGAVKVCDPAVLPT